jgi:hypothetical protein
MATDNLISLPADTKTINYTDAPLLLAKVISKDLLADVMPTPEQFKEVKFFARFDSVQAGLARHQCESMHKDGLDKAVRLGRLTVYNISRLPMPTDEELEALNRGYIKIADFIKYAKECGVGVQLESMEGGSANSQDDTYTKRTISFNNWLNGSLKELDAYRSVEVIFEEVQKTDSALWKVSFETFKKEFWQSYCTETGYKRKRGRKKIPQ